MITDRVLNKSVGAYKITWCNWQCVDSHGYAARKYSFHARSPGRVCIRTLLLAPHNYLTVRPSIRPLVYSPIGRPLRVTAHYSCCVDGRRRSMITSWNITRSEPQVLVHVKPLT